MSSETNPSAPPKVIPDTSANPVSFTELIMGFSSAALYHLGEANFDESTQKAQNLPLAKQNIDIIEMLKTKSAGNRTTEEDGLISEVLRDLKTKLIAARPKYTDRV